MDDDIDPNQIYNRQQTKSLGIKNERFWAGCTFLCRLFGRIRKSDPGSAHKLLLFLLVNRMSCEFGSESDFVMLASALSEHSTPFTPPGFAWRGS